MSDLDLGALGAPIEALRDDVKAAYERVDAKWEAIIERLKSLPIPCAVSYCLWESDSCMESRCLEYRKYSGKKRICLTYYSIHSQSEECDITPYDEWSGEQRVDMLKHVPNLFERATAQTKEFIAKTME